MWDETLMHFLAITMEIGPIFITDGTDFIDQHCVFQLRVNWRFLVTVVVSTATFGFAMAHHIWASANAIIYKNLGTLASTFHFMNYSKSISQYPQFESWENVFQTPDTRKAIN